MPRFKFSIVGWGPEAPTDVIASLLEASGRCEEINKNGPVVKASLEAGNASDAEAALRAVIYTNAPTSVQAHFATDTGQLRTRLELPDA